MTSYIYDMVDTWNAGATTFTAVKMNVTDTASAAGSLLMDLQVGGSSRFAVEKSGALYVNGVSNWNTRFISSSTQLSLQQRDAQFEFINPYNTTNRFFLRATGAGKIQLGAADAAAPVAQTLSVQSVVAGTSNTAGANLTITGSQGTGTGAGGSIVFQVAPAGLSGPNQNALSSLLTLSTTGMKVNGAVSKVVFEVENQTYPDFRMPTFSLQNGSAAGLWFYTEPGMVSFGTGANLDIKFYRDDANKLALRNGANAQTFRVYNTTDGTNSEYGKIAWSSNVLQIGTEKAGTGTARALQFQTDGTTRLTLNTAGLATFSGTITVSGGVVRTDYINSSNDQISWLHGSDDVNGRMTFASGRTNPMFRFGGTTSSFPAIKRSSTALETKLADDSAYAPHAMQYLDVTDGITAPASATGRARIYVDTADGDLKVIFADGTVKTIVTDT